MKINEGTGNGMVGDAVMIAVENRWLVGNMKVERLESLMQGQCWVEKMKIERLRM